MNAVTFFDGMALVGSLVALLLLLVRRSGSLPAEARYVMGMISPTLDQRP